MKFCSKEVAVDRCINFEFFVTYVRKEIDLSLVTNWQIQKLIPRISLEARARIE